MMKSTVCRPVVTFSIEFVPLRRLANVKAPGASDVPLVDTNRKMLPETGVELVVLTADPLLRYPVKLTLGPIAVESEATLNHDPPSTLASMTKLALAGVALINATAASPKATSPRTTLNDLMSLVPPGESKEVDRQ